MSMRAWEAVEKRADLQQYGSNRLLLFALEVGLNVDDIHTVAATALTDGKNDKKCDLLYVDRDSGRAIIAQGFLSSDPTKAEAPANKAADLNTAVAWLLDGELATLPGNLRAAATELRSALEDQRLSSIEIWYVHNLPESTNVDRELDRVRATADSHIRRNYPASGVENISALEVGRHRLDEWLKSIEVPIHVTDQLVLEVPGGFETEGDGWKAFTTSVPARWLHQLYAQHKSTLFSANVRDYLGSRASDRNINNNIKDTARSSPARFWAYNNGLTALVADYSYTDSDGQGQLQIDGIAIVNGAQTTGAIGSLPEPPGPAARVLARFVKCRDRELIRQIIRFNNMQNKVEPSDFRSQDAVQERLRREFESTGLLYRGGRRGGDADRIERPRNLVPHTTAAQALAAFHQEPNIAYNEKSRIWESDAVYSRFFHDRTSTRHLLLCFSLVRAIEATKQELLRIEEGERTESQKSQIGFFRQRGSIWILCSAMGRSCEVFVGKAIPDRFSLRFAEGVDVDAAIDAWRGIMEPGLSFVGSLEPALRDGLKKAESIRSSVAQFASFVEATRAANSVIYAEFSRLVEL